MWSKLTRECFEALVTKCTSDARVFDALTIRDQLRQQLGTVANLTYNDVFSELWHYYRKDKFSQLYVVRTKLVVYDPENGDTTTTVEYVPAVQVVLKKVREQWASTDAKLRLDAMDMPKR
jgi:hypothetical protein